MQGLAEFDLVEALRFFPYKLMPDVQMDGERK
jgi:hypothetical protein